MTPTETELELWRETVAEQKDFRRRHVAQEVDGYKRAVKLLLQYIDYLNPTMKGR